MTRGGRGRGDRWVHGPHTLRPARAYIQGAYAGVSGDARARLVESLVVK